MPHEARDNGNGEIVVIEQFKGTISFFAELNTVDSHGSLAPSVGMRHLFLTRTNALQGVKCLLNSTKPGKTEKRPLGIPTMETRAQQALGKMALEPEWEARFEPNSYGFRPGRSCHDAIEAILNAVRYKPKYVFDADISGCFDNIDHSALLSKLNTYPALRHIVKMWLKAGVMDAGVFVSTEKGTPQGGVASPLLANIALHGMEQVISTYHKGQEKALLVRYADDVRHLTHNEILLAEKGGTEEYGLRVISPTWNRKAKGKGACEKRGKRVKALRRCPARPA